MSLPQALPHPEQRVAAPAFGFALRVYWEDTDAGGIVFYANYLKFMERGRTEWLRALGFGQQALKQEAGGMFVVSQTQVNYHRPARLDDTLWVTAEVTQMGRASLTLAQQVWLRASGQPDTLLADGSIRIGWVDAVTLQPGRIPAAILQVLQT